MKNMDLARFIRQDIAQMDEYNPVPSLWDLSKKFNQEPIEVLKLDAGENQFGYSSMVVKALNVSNFFNFYPDPQYIELRKAIATYVGVGLENITVGSGSDELLDLILRLILDYGEKVISCPPTFGMYSCLLYTSPSPRD